MPKFPSLRPVSPLPINDEVGEPLSAFHTTATENVENIFNQEIELPHAAETPTPSGKQYSQVDPITPLSDSQPVQSGTTTQRAQTTPLRYRVPQTDTEKPLQSLQPYQPQSLLTALQLTMEPKTNRLPVLIPAEMKKSKALAVTEERSTVTRRTMSRFKVGIVLGAMVAFTFLTALSFGPVNQGKHLLPFIDMAMQHSQGQGQNSALSLSPAPGQNNLVNVPVPPLPNIPRSDLVALAQQDAVRYGISPVYFVRQIYAESGFNPNAYSPAGAVGIAQFIPSTAASLGINPYDPVQALDGAAKYMARLSSQFGGDYAKGLAAYNAVSGAVQRAVNAAGDNWLSLMPYETQIYIKKIMGMM